MNINNFNYLSLLYVNSYASIHNIINAYNSRYSDILLYMIENVKSNIDIYFFITYFNKLQLYGYVYHLYYLLYLTNDIGNLNFDLLNYTYLFNNF